MSGAGPRRGSSMTAVTPRETRCPSPPTALPKSTVAFGLPQWPAPTPGFIPPTPLAYSAAASPGRPTRNTVPPSGAPPSFATIAGLISGGVMPFPPAPPVSGGSLAVSYTTGGVTSPPRCRSSPLHHHIGSTVACAAPPGPLYLAAAVSPHSTIAVPRSPSSTTSVTQRPSGGGGGGGAPQWRQCQPEIKRQSLPNQQHQNLSWQSPPRQSMSPHPHPHPQPRSQSPPLRPQPTRPYTPPLQPRARVHSQPEQPAELRPQSQPQPQPEAEAQDAQPHGGGDGPGAGADGEKAATKPGLPAAPEPTWPANAMERAGSTRRSVSRQR